MSFSDIPDRFIPGTEADRGVLFGVAIVRVQGPDEYVHAFPEYVTEKDILKMQSLPAKISDSEDSSASGCIASPASALLPSGSISTVPQRPVGSIGIMGLSPRAGGPLGMGMAPVSFAMGGIQPQQNMLVGGVRTPAVSVVPGIAQDVTQPSVVPAPVPAALKETIKKVAQFCASNGASTISMLKKKEGALNVMPFLFEGQIGFEEFLSTLKEILGMASAINSANNRSSSSSIPPPPVPPPARPNPQK